MGFADHGVAPEIVGQKQPFIARTGLGWAVFQAHFIDQNGGGGMGGTWAWLPSPSGHRLPSSVPWNVFSFFFSTDVHSAVVMTIILVVISRQHTEK